MIIYRLTREAYKDDLSGFGAFTYGGRWNSRGLYALYAAEHISLAVLEIVVNYDRSLIKMQPTYCLQEIQVPENSVIETDIKALKKNWLNDWDYSRYVGDQFLQSRSGLLLKVPSAVIPEEHNFLINPVHTDFKKLKLMRNKPYGIDRRLL